MVVDKALISVSRKMYQRKTMNFVWNEEKSKSNLHKHGISFDTAIYVFTDPNRVEIYDQKHSMVTEDRFITIGYVENVPLFVVYTVVDDQTIRIISARKALKVEVGKYYQKK